MDGEFIQKSGEYSYIAIASLSFLLGVFSSLIIEFVKSNNKRNSLIELFLNDIRQNYLHTANLITAPTGDYKSTGTLFYIKGVKGLKLKGNPEYMFEVYNIKLLETEGIELTKLLKSSSRSSFWKVFTLVRDVEEVRKILLSLPESSNDYSSYQKIFLVLVKKLSSELKCFEKILRKELSWYRYLKLQ